MLSERQVALLWLASRRKQRIAARLDSKYIHLTSEASLRRLRARKIMAQAEWRNYLADQKMGG